MRPIYGCPEKFRESLYGYAHGYFCRNGWAFVVIDRVKVRTKIEVRITLPVPEKLGSP